MITAIKIILWFLSPICLISGVFLCVCGVYYFVEEIRSKPRAAASILLGLAAFAFGIMGILFATGGMK